MTPVKIKRVLTLDMMTKIRSFVLEFGEDRVTDHDGYDMSVKDMDRAIEVTERFVPQQMDFCATFYFQDLEKATEFKLRFC